MAAISRARAVGRAVPSHRRGSALRIRDLRVSTKLLLVLAIPLLGFLTVTGIQVNSSIRSATELNNFARQVALGREVNALVHELQRERDRTVGALATVDQPGTAGKANLADLAPDRTAVDRTAGMLAAAAQPLRGNATFDHAYLAASAGLNELPHIRDGVQSGWLRAAATFDAYTEIIAGLHTLLSAPATHAELGQSVRALAEASRAKELTAQIRGLLFAVCSAGGFGPGQFETITNVRAQQQAALERFRDDASAAQLASWDGVVSGQAVRNARRLEQTVVDNATSAELGVDAQQWWQASTTQLELIRGAEQQLLEDAIEMAKARSADQQHSTELVTLASVVLLLVALLASFVVGRTMVHTLRSLREQALEIAQRRLPDVIERLRSEPKAISSIAVDPIAIRSADEVGEVAEAFTAVHRNAVRLAAEQAMMRHNINAIYVNLARRSQALVERQLQLLDTLELSETDPDQLANLFRLDHLATRMRRNDDNLLVLAGGDTTRRWSEPVPLTAVVLAAAAEIEHYTRVRHDITDDIHVVGHVVADLVHLLAELLENATIFSPSDTSVTVLGWAVDVGGVLVIEDEGLGLSPEATARANRQLAAPVSIDVAAAERMGLVVVGHLAHRHGIRVELSSHGRGVAVVVAIPQELLAGPLALSTTSAAMAPAEATNTGTVPAGAVTPGASGWLRTERESGVIIAGATGGAHALAGPTTARAGVTGPPSSADSGTADSGTADPGHSGALLAEPVPINETLPVLSRTGPLRRHMPTRAEDVLGAGRIESGSIWWSRPSAAAAGPAAGGPPRAAAGSVAGGPPRAAAGQGVPAVPRQRPAREQETSAGLPLRVPMTHLPHSVNAAGHGHPASAAKPSPQADPRAAAGVLSQFYGGVHRALAEDDDVNDDDVNTVM